MFNVSLQFKVHFEYSPDLNKKPIIAQFIVSNSLTYINNFLISYSIHINKIK